MATIRFPAMVDKYPTKTNQRDLLAQRQGTYMGGRSLSSSIASVAEELALLGLSIPVTSTRPRSSVERQLSEPGEGSRSPKTRSVGRSRGRGPGRFPGRVLSQRPAAPGPARQDRAGRAG